MAASLEGYIAQSGWKNKWPSTFPNEVQDKHAFLCYNEKEYSLSFVKKTKGDPNDEKTKNRCLGPRLALGTALAQYSATADTRSVFGNIPEQIDEINEKHTNTRYFKDVVLD